jgi:hypothetical protein
VTRPVAREVRATKLPSGVFERSLVVARALPVGEPIRGEIVIQQLQRMRVLVGEISFGRCGNECNSVDLRAGRGVGGGGL